MTYTTTVRSYRMLEKHYHNGYWVPVSDYRLEVEVSLAIDMRLHPEKYADIPETSTEGHPRVISLSQEKEAPLDWIYPDLLWVNGEARNYENVDLELLQELEQLGVLSSRIEEPEIEAEEVEGLDTLPRATIGFHNGILTVAGTPYPKFSSIRLRKNRWIFYYGKHPVLTFLSNAVLALPPHLYRKRRGNFSNLEYLYFGTFNHANLKEKNILMEKIIKDLRGHPGTYTVKPSHIPLPITYPNITDAFLYIVEGVCTKKVEHLIYHIQMMISYPCIRTALPSLLLYLEQMDFTIYDLSYAFQRCGISYSNFVKLLDGELSGMCQYCKTKEAIMYTRECNHPICCRSCYRKEEEHCLVCNKWTTGYKEKV